MLAGGELTRDPRARRAAAAAIASGYEVVGVCGSGAAPIELAHVQVVRIGGETVSGRLRRAGLGGMTRSNPLARELRGVFRAARLAATSLRLGRVARRLGPFDVIHAHDFDTLPAARLAQLGRGRARLVYDAHELYADQEPEAPRLFRTCVRLFEGPLARRSDAVVTVDDELATELQGSLRLPRRPHVVLSCPGLTPVDPAARGNGHLRALYQGAMGPGRRLSDLFDALQHAEGVELTIRVVNADLDELRKAVSNRGLTDRIEVVDPVAPDRLVQAAADFHVGLVINRPVTRNDELVLPNKLFEYLMAGLAVVAPRLPALAPLVEGEGVGLTYEPGAPETLGAALTSLARDDVLLARLRERGRQLAVERYNAETQAETLVHVWQAR
jgi:glycosyltransferase involved in cell wall biosynthesis